MKKVIIILIASLALTVAVKSQEYINPIFKNDSIFLFNTQTKAYQFIFKTSAVQGITALDVYPVGSIYISVSSTNPSSLFGGTWVAFAVGRTLIGVDANQTEFDTVEETGGAKTQTLTEAQMPPHTHNIPDVRSATTGGVNTRIARTADASSTAGNDVATGSAGSGDPVSILNPYITVYFFKRTL
jgi:hypothetical protein